MIMTGKREYSEKNLSDIHGARHNYPSGSSGITSSYSLIGGWRRFGASRFRSLFCFSATFYLSFFSSLF